MPVKSQSDLWQKRPLVRELNAMRFLLVSSLQTQCCYPDTHGSASDWRVGSGSASKWYAGSGSAPICRWQAKRMEYEPIWALFGPLFGARIQIRIRIKETGRTRIRIRIKVTSRIRIGTASKWEAGSGFTSKWCGSVTLDRHAEIYTLLINFISRSMCAVWTGWKRTSWNRFGWWIPRRWTPSSITISIGTFFIPGSRDLASSWGESHKDNLDLSSG